MTNLELFTQYERIGKAFINSYKLSLVGHIENLKTEEATIVEVFYGQTAPCIDGTPAPKGLNIRVNFDSYGCSGLTFTDSDDILDILNNYKVDKPEELIGKRVRTFCKGTRLAGIEPI